MELLIAWGVIGCFFLLLFLFGDAWDRWATDRMKGQDHLGARALHWIFLLIFIAGVIFAITR
jgi:hypothetical protein